MIPLMLNRLTGRPKTRLASAATADCSDSRLGAALGTISLERGFITIEIYAKIDMAAFEINAYIWAFLAFGHVEVPLKDYSATSSESSSASCSSGTAVSLWAINISTKPHRNQTKHAAETPMSIEANNGVFNS